MFANFFFFNFCCRVHKNLSIFVVVSTVVFIKKKIVGICQYVHKYLSSVFAATQICLFLSLCSQIFFINFCCRVHKNLSIFVVVSTKLCQCHRYPQKNLSMFVIVWTETCHLTVNLTHPNHSTSLYYFAFIFHSLSRHPSSFSDHIPCVSHFSVFLHTPSFSSFPITFPQSC